MSSAKPIKPTSAGVPSNPPATAAPVKVSPAVGAKLPPLYRRIDWMAFALTTLLTFIGYYLTLAPDLTLEDSGELAVGSFYAGVPHPPGYPVWTIYTWLFTVLFPVANVAYRVAMASAVASALSCGMVGLLVSRGSSMIIEGLAEMKSLERRWENAICLISGLTSGMILGFNGFIWSQAVIVEVYTFGLLSLMATLTFLMRWVYAPHQRRYLYAAFLMFGLCFTNHQTLIVAAMGLEIAVMLADAKLGRDLFLANSVAYLIGLFLILNDQLISIGRNPPLFMLFNFIGVSSIVICGWLTLQTKRLLSEWKPLVIMTLMWLFGAGFYFYMPLASMTNPPMNWGYPRTVEGFFHALTRGQYDRTKPTEDFITFLDQIRIYLLGGIEEFNVAYLVIALVPLIYLFYARMQPKEAKRTKWISAGFFGLFIIGLFIKLVIALVTKKSVLLILLAPGTWIGLGGAYALLLIVIIPFVFYGSINRPEKAWIGGLAAIFFCLAVILLFLLNPGPDKQSRDLNKVFFTASYVMIAIWIGYGLAIMLSWLATQYDKFRHLVLYSLAGAAGIAIYNLVATIYEGGNPLMMATAVSGIGLVFCALVALLLARQRAPLTVLLALVALMPSYTIISHWWDNEQRGHLFGYWFGHDMFTPPFKDATGKPLYPEMTRNAILFGGTDPGRFCPTYMIFCESFIPPSKKPRDPNFDRRDVYIITQNALADATYLCYIRAHYNRSTQKDPPFFQELFKSSLFAPLDNFFLGLGNRIEDRRRKEGVYPPVEINTPTLEDSKTTFDEYMNDFQVRMQKNQLKPGEDFKIIDNKIQVSGQVSVMQINGLLTKIIFDRNPTNEFFVEESFPLDWMYPYLTPFGIIMKINRQPVPELTEDIVKRDHEFWTQYANRLCGNWITYDTPIKDLCDFVQRVYLRGDFRGFKGDPKFIRDNDAQKAFSKLRSALAGVYAWRVNASKSRPEQERMIKEAEFAFKQAFAFCPFSPEALFRYVNLLASLQRWDDALLLARTCAIFDPENRGMRDLAVQLEQMKANNVNINQAQNQLGLLEQQYAANPSNLQLALTLANAYAQAQLSTQADELLDRILAPLEQSVKTNPSNLQLSFGLVSAYVQKRQIAKAVTLLDQLVASPKADATVYINAAQAFAQLGNAPKLEEVMLRLVKVMPTNQEAWYDLAGVQASMNKNAESLNSLGKALALNAQQIEKDPKAKDFAQMAVQDARFVNLRALPEFKNLLARKAK